MEKPKNIILVGFMGVGKSCIGEEVANLLHYPFIDTDILIEKKEKKKISEIFEEKGEEYFRMCERDILKRLCKVERTIISTGGGIVERRENRELLSSLGFVVNLVADQEIIFERVGLRSNRPLLVNLSNREKREKIATLMKKREILYKEIADMKVDTGELKTKDCAYGIIDSARIFFSIYSKKSH